MHNRTYIRQEKKSSPGHKPMKGRLSLLMRGKASGDFKVKPLLVYHSDNSRVFKQNNVIRSELLVMWRTNRKAWATQQFFTEWMHEVFSPSVKECLLKKYLSFKCLLLLDNVPAHPPGLEEDLVNEYNFVQGKFLPPNTTPLLQPMVQQGIANFLFLK
ncbi:DDE superfamily endonuclease domain [Trinorchestia longiramus]|nr:DDE superfamily endonuclease domain [Trinorchestia longiramus]